MYVPTRTRTILAIDTTKQVKVFNRTARVLDVRVDGRIWPLQPGDNFLPAVCVPYAQRQHPRMGTFAKGAVMGESLIGVYGHTPAEFMTPLQPGKEHRGNERIDRTENPLPPNMIVERMPSERTQIDMAAIGSIQEATNRSSIESRNDNGLMPAPSLAGITEMV